MGEEKKFSGQDRDGYGDAGAKAFGEGDGADVEGGGEDFEGQGGAPAVAGRA
jgi:hypothetical protein